MVTIEHRLASLPNLRDLGGHLTADGGRVRRGVVFRSEAPHLATPADATALHERLRIAEVVDLRRPEEHDACPLPAPLATHARWHRVPFDLDVPPHLSDRIGAAGRLTSADMGRFYAWMAQQNLPQLRQVLDLLADATAPTLVHCAVGKDRTGVTVAVTLLAIGVDADAVVADYALSDAAMRAVLPRHDDRLTDDRIDDDVRLRAPAAAMRALLDHLAEAHGSLAAFVDDLDPDGARRRRLRARLVEPPAGTAANGAAAGGA